MKKVLVIGAAGYLGQVLCATCRDEAGVAVYGTCRLGATTVSNLYPLDLLDGCGVAALVDELAPDVVVWCAKDEAREYELNDVGLRNLLAALGASMRLIYLSTALADGAGQNEQTPPQSRAAGAYLSGYVNGKILGENLARSHGNHVIIRPGQIYGRGANGQADSRMRRLADAVAANGTMTRSANALISVIHVEDLARCIVELIAHTVAGTFCLAAERPVSYYDFYRHLAGQIGVDAEKIVPIYDEKPAHCYFDVTKAKSMLGTPLWMLEGTTR